MSGDKHTPEPWDIGVSADNGLPCVDKVGSVFVEICECWGGVDDKEETEQSQANARRIVACINACAGIPTHELELAATRKTAWNCLEELGESAHWHANKGDTK